MILPNENLLKPQLNCDVENCDNNCTGFDDDILRKPIEGREQHMRIGENEKLWLLY